ncbi:MAG: polysaccharide biosynthesis/export family protein [Verrucomicrobiota bacterium]
MSEEKQCIQTGRKWLPAFLFVASLLLVFAQFGQAQVLLREGDTIEVKVFDEPLVSGVFPVSAGGTIGFPLLGQLPAVGKSTDELAAQIDAGLRDGYIREPSVTVSLVDQKEHSVRVIGQVGSPQDVTFRPGEEPDLQTALGMAGNLGVEADDSKIELRRGGRVTMLALDSSKSMKLQHGDIVFVPQLGKLATFTISGEVASPGEYELPRDRAVGLQTAILRAGGFTPLARSSRTTIVRVGEEKPISIDPDDEPNFVIEPDDQIKVGRRIF